MKTSEFNFEKLKVWQKGRELSKEVYQLTSSFPVEEKYGLTAQVRRSVVSICSNLAEGCSRKSYRDKARFTEIAYGSLLEGMNQIILAMDLGYLREENYQDLRARMSEISRMMNALREHQLKRF